MTKYKVRKTAITKEECDSGKKFYWRWGEQYYDEEDGDWIEWGKLQHLPIEWVENPFYGDIPGPAFNGVDCVYFDSEKCIYTRYPDWSEHIVKIYEGKVDEK